MRISYQQWFYFYIQIQKEMDACDINVPENHNVILY